MFNPEIITLFQKYIYIYPKRIKNYNTRVSIRKLKLIICNITSYCLLDIPKSRISIVSVPLHDHLIRGYQYIINTYILQYLRNLRINLIIRNCRIEEFLIEC